MNKETRYKKQGYKQISKFKSQITKSLKFGNLKLFGFCILYPCILVAVFSILLVNHASAAVTYYNSASTPADNGTNTANPTTITPPASMQDGDLAIIIAGNGGASGNPAITNTGGQTWTALTQRNATNTRVNVFWARFNGTWSASPTVTLGATTNNIVVMHVFRPTGTNYYWEIDVAESSNTYAAPSSPYTITINGITTQTAGALVFAVWTCRDDNTWTSLTAGWSTPGSAQYRNTSGTTDQSVTAAYQIFASATSTGNVSKTQATSPADPGTYYILAFKETAYVVPTVTTQAASSIATSTATLNGDITATGGVNATIRGFVYGTSSQSLPGNVDATSSGYTSYTETSGSYGTGAYTANLSSLPQGTTYYVRSYARNSVGYSYGNEISFTTLTPPIEWVSIIDTGTSTYRDYSSLAMWAALNVDLTSAATKVFSWSTASGTIPDGYTVVGATSGALASSTHMSTTTASGGNQQILLSHISGIFQNGEQVYIQGMATSSYYVYLSSAGNPAIAVATCRASTGLADTAAVVINGWTTSADYYIKIWTDPSEGYRHAGKWDETKYRLQGTQYNAYYGFLTVQEDYTQIDGLQIYVTAGVNEAYGICVGLGSSVAGTSINVSLSNNIIRGSNSGYSWFQGITYFNNNNGTGAHKIWNNIVTDFTGLYSYGLSIYNTAATVYAYNNTIVDCGVGIGISGDSIPTSLIAKNNLVKNCEIPYNIYDSASFGVGTDNNSTDSDDTPGVGTHNLINQNFKFVDELNDDFHLASNDMGARNRGADLSADTYIPFSDDIDDDTRSIDIWDIGADETENAVFYSVGQNTSDHSSGGNVAIANGLATFDTAQTATNLGIGDVLTAGSRTFYLYEKADTAHWYVQTATGTTPADLSSSAVTSIAHAYPSLNNAMASSSLRLGTSDLAAGNFVLNVPCYFDTGADTQAVTVDGFTTGTSTYIKIYTPTNTATECNQTQRHSGKWDESKYRLITGTGGMSLYLSDNYTVVEGLQVQNTGSAIDDSCIVLYEYATNFSLSNNIVRGGDNGIVYTFQTELYGTKIYNNIVYGANRSGIIINTNYYDGSVYIYNNTVYGNNLSDSDYNGGISGGLMSYVYNNISMGHPSGTYKGDYLYLTNSGYNISSDATASGTGSQINTTVNFVDPANGDFHLAPGDFGARNKGADLSNDPYLLINSDIDNDERPAGSLWDIGADEAIFRIYRSIAPNKTNELDYGRTGYNLTMTATSVAFSADVPDNVGVGDVIVYNASSSLAFITGRNSATSFTVESATGTPVRTQTSTTAWAIYRAYTSLSNAEAGIENTGIPAGVRNFDTWTDGRDIASTSEQWNIAAYANGTTADSYVTIDGWTTAENNFIKVYTPTLSTEVGVSERHVGKWDNNKYQIEHDSSDYNAAIWSNEEYVRIDGLQIRDTSSPLDSQYPIAMGGSAAGAMDLRISNNIIRGSGFYTIGSAGSGIFIDAVGANSVVRAWNNIVYDFNTSNDAGLCAYRQEDSDTTAYIYNNTFYNTRYATHAYEGKIIAKNNLAQSVVVFGAATNGYYGLGTDYNYSDDDMNYNNGPHGQYNITISLADSANYDFHLSPADNIAKNAGKDLSRDLYLPITTDVDGGARSKQETGFSYDIGADEVSATPVYFSVGQNTNSHEVGAGNVNVATGTAYFSVAQTASTTGVGDKLTAGSRTFYISGKISDTAWSVVTATGSMPATLATTSVTSIAHAFASLFAAEAGIPALLGTSDLVSGGYQLNIPCYYDSGPDTTAVNIIGWVTGEDNYIKIYTPTDTDTEVNQTQRHNGVWNNNKYYLNSNNNYPLNLNINNVKIDGLQILVSGSANWLTGIQNTYEVDNIDISNNIVRNTNSGLYGTGISLNGDSNKVWNNIVYDFTNDAWGIGCDDGVNDESCYVFNNTMYNCRIGITTGYLGTIAVNNLIDANNYNYDGTFAVGSGYNAGNLSDEMNVDTGAGPNNTVSQTFVFVDETNDDFRLAKTDTSAVDAATSSLISQFPNFSISNDIEGEARLGTWDIGADEMNLPEEFVSVIDPGNGAGTDFDSLSEWNTVVHADLTLASTRVFSWSTASGTIPDGATVVGNTSGAIATATHMTATTTLTGSAQILLTNISGTFQSGEQVSLQGYATSSVYIYLSNSGNTVIAVAKCRTSDGSPDYGGIVFIGWETDVNHYVKIWADPDENYRHNGEWNEEKYRIISNDYFTTLWINSLDVVIDGLQIENVRDTSVDGSGDGIRYSDNGDTHVIISNNIVRKQAPNGVSTTGINFDSYEAYNTTLNIYNNILYDFTNGIRLSYINNGHVASINNNTIVNNYYGIHISGWPSAAVLNLYNNLVQSHNQVVDYELDTSGVAINRSANISSDNTSPDGSTYQNKIVMFADEDNDNFHLDSADTKARNKGANLTADVYLPISDDIDGNDRLDTAGTWDIGADENIAKIYRSVGPNATADLSNGGSLEIRIASSSTGGVADYVAYFTTAQPDNVGVGDAIQYDKDNGGSVDSIVFITKRYNSNYYSVRTATGSAPFLTTTADEDWGIYRAYTALFNAEAGDENDAISDTVEAFENWANGKDLYNNQEQWNIACYVGESNASDTVAVSINDWIAADENFINIYTPVRSDEVGVSQRHLGTINSGGYVLAPATTDTAISMDEDWSYVSAVIDGLVIKTNDATGIRFGGDGYFGLGNVTIKNNIVKRITGSSEFRYGIHASFRVEDQNAYINNNIISNFYGGIAVTYSIGHVYNNTLYNNFTGILSNTFSGINAKNNLSYNNTNNNYAIYDGVFSSDSSNNLSGPSFSDAPGLNPQNAKTVIFKDVANGDFHLAPGDFGARNKGADLSNDLYLPINTDIDNDERPAGTLWDIGADEAIFRIYRSIAPNKTNELDYGRTGRSLTMTATSVAFSADVPDNVGVGDVIVYNASSSLAFITGRNSATSFTVESATGTPVRVQSSTIAWAIYRAYTSLSNAEAGTENTGIPAGVRNFDTWTDGKDIASSSEQWNIATYANGTTTDTGYTVIDDWTTAPQNYLKIFTPVDADEVGISQRHQGKWDNSKYNILASDSDMAGISIYVADVQIDGLQINRTRSGNGNAGIYIYGIFGDGDVRISSNLIKATTGSSGYLYGIVSENTTAGSISNYIYNNILYEDGYSFTDAIFARTNGYAFYIYNNTIYNSSQWGNILGDNYSVVIAKNNLAYNPTASYDNYTGSFISSDYNVSNDSSDTGGAHDKINAIVNFVDPANGDFHLAANDSVAKNAGKDLSNDPYLPITTDVDGQARSKSVTGFSYDIGADEVSATPVYFSVGQNTSNHETGTANVNVATGTAYFSEAQTATNMGVGDKLTAGGRTFYISGKISDTQWTVVTATGSMPATLATTSVTSIAHAFNSLANAEAGIPALLGTSDLVSGGYQLNIPCYYDSGPDTTAVDIAGWTTGVDNYIKIYTPDDITTEVNQSQRHSGVWSADKYYIQLTASNNYVYAIVNEQEYVKIDGLQITVTGSTGYEVIDIYNSAEMIEVSNNILRNQATISGTGYAAGFNTTESAVVWNNIIYDQGDHGYSINAINWNEAIPIYVINNTIYNSNVCIYSYGFQDLYLYNNIVQNCTNGFDGGTWNSNSDNNISDIAGDAPNATWTPGDSTTDVIFVNEASDDFRLAKTDTAAVDQGTSSLISQFPNFPISINYDIEGEARIGTWDIGADEMNLPDEFVSVIDPGNGAGTDFDSLSEWNTIVHADLTVPTTRVFSWSTASGTVPDGATVVGNTSGAIATATHMTATTTLTGSAQILLTNISGAFQSGEQVSLQGYATSSVYIYLSNSGNTVIAVAKCRTSDGSADTDTVSIDGWTADSAHYIKVWTDPDENYRHEGKWDEGKYRLEGNNSYPGLITVITTNTKIEGLQIYENYYSGIHVNTSEAGSVDISNNIIKGSDTGTSPGINFYNGGYGEIVNISNNIIYRVGDKTESAEDSGIWLGRDGYSTNLFVNAYNNTVIGFSYGFYYYYATSLLKNNISYDNTDNYYGTFDSASTNNLSGPGTDAQIPATNARNGYLVIFVDEANEDFHLDSADTAARNRGTNLTADTYLPITDDIDGNDRLDTAGTWDIGADENIAKIYRSVGPSAIADLSNGGTLEIKIASSSTGGVADYVAYFTTAQPDNVGVGDAVQYDKDNGGTVDSIAFITKRYNANYYSVRTATGSAPFLTTTADEDWGIYRSVISLNDATFTGDPNPGISGAVSSQVSLSSQDLVSYQYQLNIPCYANGTTPDATSSTVSGWTTSEDSYLKIYTPTKSDEVGISQRHTGKWDDTKYFLTYSTGDMITSYVKFLHIDGLQMLLTEAGHGDYGGIFAENNVENGGVISISNNVIKNINAADFDEYGIAAVSYTQNFTTTYYIWNNIVYGFNTTNSRGIDVGYKTVDTVYLYNNTVYGCATGYLTHASGTTIVLKNNIAYNNIDNYNGTTFSGTSNNNLSGPAQTDAPGLNPQNAKTVIFKDATNGDFHLAPGDFGARNKGADLSNDLYLPINTDIDNDERSASTLWDIGADEAIFRIYRSIAPNKTNELDYGRTGHNLTMTATSVAFSADVPDNVGVGDVIVYNASSSLAFITGRNSATSFTVESATGTPVRTQVSTTAWAIYRAYTSLSNAEAGIENTGIPTGVRNFDTWTDGRDIASTSEQWNIAAYANGTTADATSTTIDGWTMAPQNYIKVYTPVDSSEVGVSQRHAGKWDDTKYKIVKTTTADWDYALALNSDYIQVEGMQISLAYSHEETKAILGDTASVSNNHTVSNSIIRGIPTVGSEGSAFYIADQVNFYYNLYSYNNIIYDFNAGATGAGGAIIFTGNKLFVYNNTINNCYVGMYDNIGTSRAINNIIQNVELGGYWDIDFTDYNITNLAADDSGPHSKNSTYVNFVDPANGDFHLAPTDNIAKNAGKDLSKDYYLSITDDIDGEARSVSVSGFKYDIGADEVSATPVYFSVGQNTSNHETGTANVNVATGTAYFSEAQTAINMGVGDKLTAGSRTFYISGKISDTQWTVVTATGSMPVNLATTSVTSIAHAFNSLANAEAGIPALLGTSDLVSGGYQLNIPCYYDSGPDTTAVDIAGWATGEENYIKIYTPNDTDTEVNQSQRHEGVWDDEKYRLVISDWLAIYIYNTDVKIDGLQFSSDSSNVRQFITIDNSLSFNKTYISNNIIRRTIAGDTVSYGIYDNSEANTGQLYAYNNIIYDMRAPSDYGVGIIIANNGISHIFNNSIINSDRGIDVTGTYQHVKNNLVMSSGDGFDVFYSWTEDSDYNLSDIAGDAPGSHSATATVIFVDEANDDFRLAKTDTAAVDQGTSSLISQFPNFPISINYDIENEERIGTWDIGADEMNLPEEFVSVIDPGNAAGTDFTSLSAWETAVQANLVATTTRVFSFNPSNASSSMPDGFAVVGETSGATGNIVHMTASTTSAQIMIENVANGIFQSGERIHLTASTTYYVNLSNSGNTVIAVAKCRSTNGTADTTKVNISGWTVDAAHYIKVWTDPNDAYGRHRGVWNENKYWMNVSDSAGSDDAIDILEDYVWIDGLQMEMRTNIYSGSGCLGFDRMAGELKISNNICQIVDNTNNYQYAFKKYTTGSNATIKVWNNIIYGAINSSQDDGVGIRLIGVGDTDIMYLYNNTVTGSYQGYYVTGSGNIDARNNIAYNNTDNYYFLGNYSDSSNNLSGPTQSDSPGSNKISNAIVQFLDAANNDFHLSPNDTVARNAGTSTVNNLQLTVNNDIWFDIDGTARGNSWDIGADEVPVEFVSTICETVDSGGACVEKDYSGLSQWEDKVESNLSSSTTRVFSGAITGTLSENDLVTLINPGNATTTVTGYVVATTSDQILIDGITGITTPLVVVPSSRFQVTSGNYFTVSGTGDAFGASPIAIAKIDGAWSASDTTAVAIDGWTTDNDNYIKVYTTPTAKHSGKWDYGKYRLAITGNTSGALYPLLIIASNVKIDGIQVFVENSHPAGIAINMNFTWATEEGSPEASRNIIKCMDSGGADSSGIIIGNTDYRQDAKFWNNIIYDCNYNAISSWDDNVYADIYQNTMFNNRVAVEAGGGNTWTMKNNIAQNCTIGTCYSGADDFSDYNISDINDGPGPNSINAIVSFISTSTGDFHLTDNSRGIDEGFNLLASTSLFSTDVDGGSRPSLTSGLSWDIGADEVGTKIYRSVGNIATAISNAANVSITGWTATFSAVQPDNVGVGDVIQYGTGVYQLAFITGRSSSTVYSVQGYDGTQPSATTTATMNIYRAHLTLNDWETQTVANVNTGISDTVDDLVLVGQDLVASNTIMMVAAYASAAGDTEAVTIDGWTTGENNYIKVYTPVYSNEVGVTQRHGGKWDSNKYNIVNSPANANSVINNYVAYTQLVGLQIAVDGTSYGAIAYDNPGLTDLLIDSCIAKSVGGDDSKRGFELSSGPNGHIKVFNSIAYDFINMSGSGFEDWGTGSVEIYNSTIFNSYYGVRRPSSSNIKLVNVITQNCTDGFYGTFDSSSDYNISDIAGDAPNATWSAGNSAIDVAFVDEANNDFHLAPGSAGIDQGTSSPISQFPNFPISINYDIDGNYRRTWDIGADEASVEFVSTIMQTGGAFSSLSAWETANQVDLTATTTAVFDCSVATGIIPVGSSVQGGTSGALASTTVMSTSSNQILMYNIDGDFEAGETVAIQGETVAVAWYDENWGYRKKITINAAQVASALSGFPVLATTTDTDLRFTGNGGDVGSSTGADIIFTSADGTTLLNYEREYYAPTTGQIVAWIKTDLSALANTEIYMYYGYAGVPADQATTTGVWDDNYLSVHHMTDNPDNQHVRDSTGNSNGTKGSANNPEQYAGRIYAAQDMNADTEYISMADGGLWDWSPANASQPRTFETWFYPTTDPSSGQGIVLLGGVNIGSGNSYIFTYADNGGNALAGVVVNAAGTTIGSFYYAVNLTQNAWSHIAFTASDSGNCGIYINGQAQAEGYTSWDDTTTVTPPVGQTGIGNVFNPTNLDQGRFDEWRWSDTLRSSGWITTSYNNQNNVASFMSFGAETASSSVSGSSVNYCVLSNAGNPAIAVAKIDGGWTNADTNVLDVDGWTTGEYNYIKVYTTESARHRGKWDEGKYRIESADTAIFLFENYTNIDGLQIQINSVGDEQGIFVGGSYCTINNNIMKDVGVSTQWDSGGIINWDTEPSYIYNNIIYNFNLGIDAQNGHLYAYNNTVNNCRDLCFDATYLGITAKNNIALNCGNNCFDGSPYSDSSNNLSSDGTAPGSYSLTNTSVTFVDEANDDFRLMPEDTGAKNIGANLSSDATSSFATDIEGQARYDGLWDIGADEAPTILYRSVGNDTSNLLHSSAYTVTIATTTATLSADATANIGVGDVLQIGTSTYQLAFITGRISSSTYSVQSATGSLAVATTSAPVSVYRAHELLDKWAYRIVNNVNSGVDDSVDDIVINYSQNLVASNTAIFIPCYASTSPDDAHAEVNGWTTGTSTYIKIYTPVYSDEVGSSQRHSGTWDDSSYRIVLSSITRVLSLYNSNVWIDGLQIKNTDTGDSDTLSSCINSNVAAQNLKISNSIIHGSHGGSAIDFDNTEITAMMWNNLIYHNTMGTWDEGIDASVKILNIHNCTIYNFNTGINQDAGTLLAYNNAVFGNANDFDGTMTLDYNASDDKDGTNAIDISPAGFATEADAWKAAFTDYANGDFSIRDTSSVLYDSGTTIIAVTDDILGTVRPQGDGYDVGAFEYNFGRYKYRFNDGSFKVRGTLKFR